MILQKLISGLKINKIIKNMDKPWINIYSLLISLLTIGLCFGFSLGKLNFNINDFSERNIGIGVINGIDSGIRITAYLKIISTFLLSFLFTSIILSNINKFLLPKTKNFLYLLSLFGIFEILLFELSRSKIFLYICLVLLLISLIILSFNLIKIIFYKLKNNFLNNLFNLKHQSILKLILFSLIQTNTILFFLNINFSVKNSILILIIILISILIYRILFLLFFIKKEKLFNLLLIPLYFSTIILPISNEIQYTLRNYLELNPKIIFILLYIIFYLFLFIIINKNNKKIISKLLNKNLPYLITIISVGIISNYQQKIIFETLDLLHIGEFIVPTQQIFNYQKIPFIDFLPVHGLSDLFFQTLYSIINGYKYLDIIIWNNWILKTIGLLLVYIIINKASNNKLFSLLFVLALPLLNNGINGSLFNDLRIVLIPLIYILYFKKNANKKNLYYLWIINILLFFWNPSIGLPALLTSFFITMIISSKINIKILEIIKTFLKVMLITCLIFFLLLIIKKINLFNYFILVKNFFKSEPQIWGYERISNKDTQITIIQYLILPLLSLIIWIKTLFKIKNKNKLKNINIILLFLTSVSLISLTRGLCRHSLIEGFNPYLILLTLFLLPFVFYKSKKYISLTLSLLIFFVFVFIMPNYSTQFDSFNFKFVKWQKNDNRTLTIENTNYSDFKKFIKDSLTENQTFVDLTNSPLLYATTNKSLPNTFFLPNIYYANKESEKILIKNLEILYKEDKIPIVLYRNSKWFGSNIDEISSELRNMELAKFINTNYEPLTILNDYEIWLAKNNTKIIKTNYEQYNKENFLQNINMYDLPYLWANLDKNINKSNYQVLEKIILKDKETFNFKLNKSLINKNTYLLLKLQSKIDSNNYYISFGQKNISKINFKIHKSNKPEEYLINPNILFKWFQSDGNIINLEKTENIFIENISLIELK